jgi:hypothetical protein
MPLFGKPRLSLEELARELASSALRSVDQILSGESPLDTANANHRREVMILELFALNVALQSHFPDDEHYGSLLGFAQGALCDAFVATTGAAARGFEEAVDSAFADYNEVMASRSSVPDKFQTLGLRFAQRLGTDPKLMLLGSVCFSGALRMYGGLVEGALAQFRIEP